MTRCSPASLRAIGRAALLSIVFVLGVLSFPHPSPATTVRQTDAGTVVFRIEDAIAWARLIAFADNHSSSSESAVALFSPDGSHFLIHTLHGDLQMNVNVERLLPYPRGRLKLLAGPVASASNDGLVGSIYSQRRLHVEKLVLRWRE